MAKLTPRQLRFVQEYIIDLNATQAAIRAGYSQKTAMKIGSENLQKPEVVEEIEAHKRRRSERTQIDADWLLTRLANEADADLSDLYDEDGNVRPMKEWPKIWRQGLVQGLDTEEITQDGVKVGVVRKLRLDNRVRRLELIGKHVKVQAFQENVNHKGLEGLGERLARAERRARGESDE